MLAYLSNFFSGGVDSTRPHVILLSVTVLASFAVAAGIVFESPKYPESIHRIATKLVIGGVAVEAVCTIFLFVFDEGISNAQQSKIISLETQIAPRRISPDACREIADSMKSLSGRIEVDSYGADLEGGILAWQISSCLEGPEPRTVSVDRRLASVMPMGGFGVGVFVSGPNEKLVAAIRSGLVEKGKIFVAEGKGLFLGNMSMSPQNAAPPDALVLVAVRPLPEMMHK